MPFKPVILPVVAISSLLLAVGCEQTPVVREIGKPQVQAVEVPVAPPPMTPERRKLHQESFVMVWETVRDRHWDPDLNGLQWDAVREEFEPRVDAAETDDEVRSLLNDMLARIGESHFGIVPSSVYEEMSTEAADEAALRGAEEGGAEGSNETGDEGGSSEVVEAGATETETEIEKPRRSRTGKGSLGIEARVVDDRAFVFRVEDGSPAAEAGVQTGWELVEVDGRKLARSLSRIRKHDEGSPSLQMHLAGSVHGRLGGRVGDEVDVIFALGDGKRRQLALTLAPPVGTSTSFGHLPEMHFHFHTKRIGADVGYIRFNMFMDAMKLASEFEKAMLDYMECRGIIIDLRGNPGGIGAMVMGLSGWMVDEEKQYLGEMKTREQGLKFTVFPRAQTYSGPVAILIDGCSASTSEIFAQGLRDLDRARLFGRRTSGAALPSLFVELPNGDRFQYAMADYISFSGHRIEGNGVEPHHAIALDPEWLASGDDKDIDAALHWIREAE